MLPAKHPFFYWAILRIQVLFCSGWINFRKGTGTTGTVTTDAVGAFARSSSPQCFAVGMGCEWKWNKRFWRQDLKHKKNLLSVFQELQGYCVQIVSTGWECFFSSLFCKDNFHVNCSFGAEKMGWCRRNQAVVTVQTIWRNLRKGCEQCASSLWLLFKLHIRCMTEPPGQIPWDLSHYLMAICLMCGRLNKSH